MWDALEVAFYVLLIVADYLSEPVGRRILRG